MTTFYSLLLVHSLMQTPMATPTAPSEPVKPAANPVTNGNGVAKTATTDAEKIANARDSIKQASEAIEKIQSRLADPEGEYQKAEKAFEELNTNLKNLRMMAARFRKDGKDEEATVIENMLPKIEEDWQLAKERFDIAIRQKKASLDAIAGLKERIASDQQVLDRLEGNTPAPTTPPPPASGTTNGSSPQPAVNGTTPVNSTPTPAAAPATTPAATVPAAAPASPPASTTPASTTTTNTETKPATDSATAVTSLIPGMPAIPAPTNGSAPAPAATTSDPLRELIENDLNVQRLRDLLEKQRVELRDVEERMRLTESQVKAMERSIQTAQKSLQIEQESIAQSEKEAAKISNTLDTEPPADPAERDALAEKLGKTMERTAQSRDQAQRILDKITTLRESLTGLQSELNLVTKEAEASRKRVTDTEAELATLLSPTSPRNLFRLAISKAPRVLIIIVGMLLVQLIVRQFSRHIVRFISRNGSRGSPEDRENRAHTLVGVFRYSAGIVVFGGGLVMLLDEMGVPIVPLMGGAAVVGLAVAFGAQNLMRDYFTGFMMLMEDQYSVNDVVRIGTIAGLVEQITLRMTVLRDLEGIRHFIPHGTITSVSNLTHGWSRAMMDIPVSYKENVDRVIAELMQLGYEMRSDPVFGKSIMDDPEMLGVDALGDSGVVIKFLLKTRPLQQWPIKREMLRRIKNRFDELGIEIPFPHRTVYHRFPELGERNQSIPINVVRAA